MGKQAAEYEKAVHLRGIFRPEAASDWSIPSTKVLFIDQPEKIAELLETANSRFTGRFQITCSKPQFLEFNPLNATKGLALAQVAELLRIPMAEIAAFGDSLNDLSMLTTAGYGIAMGNARDDVKASVRHICRTNREDGVAHYIEEYILSASEDL